MVGEILKYLSTKCGGEDTMRFLTEDNKPDISAAREYALGMREKIGPTNLVKVSQRVNAVRVRVVEDKPDEPTQDIIKFDPNHSSF